MIALRLHRRRRRPIEVLDRWERQAERWPAELPAPEEAAHPPSAIARALPPPRRLPRRPTWASPDRVARLVGDVMRVAAKPHVSHNRVAAHLDRRLRRAASPAGELERIRRELAEVNRWLEYLPRYVDAEVHRDGAEFEEDYEPLRSIAARRGTWT